MLTTYALLQIELLFTGNNVHMYVQAVPPLLVVVWKGLAFILFINTICYGRNAFATGVKRARGNAEK